MASSDKPANPPATRKANGSTSSSTSSSAPPPPTDPPELMHGEIFYDPETGLSVLQYRDGATGEWLLEFSNRVEQRIPTAIRRLTAMRFSAVLSQWITNTTPTKR